MRDITASKMLSKSSITYILMLATPLILSGFSHIWNTIGFPAIYDDEETYIKRAILVLNGQGFKDPDYPYDHPYLGQLFLAGVFKLDGYPNSLDPKTFGSDADVLHSIEMLYFVPRLLMGILSVVDTFLVYKISERYYNKNRNVALIAAVLFAVMPITWLTRMIVLDAILLPFLLSSILFAIYAKDPANNSGRNVVVLLSGIFLGLAIFTKLTAFSMVPVVAFLLLYKSNNRSNDNIKNVNNNRGGAEKNSKLKTLCLWLIPVIVIPLIWPTYALSRGEFNVWLNDIYGQTHRHEDPFYYSINSFFRIDPILLIIGIVGIGFSAAIKRDFVFLLWVVPYLVLLYFIGFIMSFHMILLLPPFCIAAARLITSLSERIPYIFQTVIKYFNGSDFSRAMFHHFRINNPHKDIFFRLFLPNASLFIVSLIGTFGLISTIMLIVMNLNSSYFEGYAFIVKSVISSSNDNGSNYENKVSILGDDRYFWIPNYVFHKNYRYKEVGFENFELEPIDSKKKILIVDEGSKSHFANEWKMIYNSTFPIAIFKRNMDAYKQINQYPYTSLSENYFHRFSLFFPIKTEIRTNLLSLNSSVYILEQSNGRIVSYVKHKFQTATPANQTSSLPLYWDDPKRYCQDYFECTINSTAGWKDNRSFQLSTSTTTNNTWSWIYGKEIDVIPGEQYVFTTHMKLNNFATGSHIKLEGYDPTSKTWNQITQCPSGTNGPLEWHEYSCKLTIPASIDKIRPVLNAGWSSQINKEAITLFDGIYLSKVSLNMATSSNAPYGNLISNPEFLYFVKSPNDSCHLEGDFPMRIQYSLVNSTVDKADKLSLIAHCSRINYK